MEEKRVEPGSTIPQSTYQTPNIGEGRRKMNNRSRSSEQMEEGGNARLIGRSE